MYSELISSSIVEGVPFASKTSYVKLLRSVKRETLKLIETFLVKAKDQPQIRKQFVPPMIDPVLGDYARNLPDARESEVLSPFAAIINNCLIRLEFSSEMHFTVLPRTRNRIRHVRTHSLKWSISEDKIRSGKKETTESETNTIDRTFETFRFATPDNSKQNCHRSDWKSKHEFQVSCSEIHYTKHEVMLELQTWICIEN
ncbi:Exportin-1 [Gossypium australe]|uniref:Exportin-1 n=1 Tax=Gossypium australe TaxID=47621 RepID=A0A5B6VD00_9ROSI|nr:Exportin-1 [Gossypium australe]